MRGLVVFAVLLFVAAGCSDLPADTTASPTTTTTVPAPVSTTTTIGAPTTTAPESFPAAALFLAAVDDALVGTSYEGEALREPEAFLSTAAVFCNLLDEGLSLREVLDAYAGALVEGSPDQSVEADDLLLGGVILGAGIRLICPQHLSLLDEVPPPTTTTVP